jgi:putative spermidine/putrescine transport system permease protein
MSRSAFYRWAGISMLLVWLVAPMIPLLIWSVSFRWFFPDLLPAQVSLRAWQYVFSPANDVWRALFDTVAIALCVTFISVLVGVPAGRALGLHQFRGKRLVELLILSPTIVPGLAVVLGIHVVFIRYGLADTFLGVVLVHLIPTLPYMTLVMSGVFANYDPNYEQQARTLGAGPAAALWYVMLPSILPGMMVGALFTFLISWSQYILTLLIGGGTVVTLPLLLFNFANSGDNAITGALSIVFILPGVVILLITARYLTGESAAVGGIGNA